MHECHIISYIHTRTYVHTYIYTVCYMLAYHLFDCLRTRQTLLKFFVGSCTFIVFCGGKLKSGFCSISDKNYLYYYSFSTICLSKLPLKNLRIMLFTSPCCAVLDCSIHRFNLIVIVSECRCALYSMITQEILFWLLLWFHFRWIVLRRWDQCTITVSWSQCNKGFARSPATCSFHTIGSLDVYGDMPRRFCVFMYSISFISFVSSVLLISLFDLAALRFSPLISFLCISLPTSYLYSSPILQLYRPGPSFFLAPVSIE